MRRITSLLAVTACVVHAHRAEAQEERLPRAGNGVLTFDAALDAARRNVPGVMAALGQSRIANAQVALARAPLLPVIAAAGTIQGYGQDSQPIGGSTVPCAPGMPCVTGSGPFGYAYADASITARWTLWDFGRTALNVEAARRAARSADVEIHVAEHSAVLAAATAYFVVLADEQVVSNAQSTLAQRQHEEEIATTRVTAGVDPDINRTRAEIATATAQLDLATARATVDNDTASLAAALGFDPAQPPRVTPPGDLIVDDTPEHSAELAVAARPELAGARLRVASAESSVAAAMAAWRPALTANGSIGGRFTQYTSGSGVVSETGSANLVLAVPIYDPTIVANVRIAEGNLVVARANLAQQSLVVRTDAVQAALAVRAAREQLASAEHNAQLAAANRTFSEGRFAAGTAPMLELVDADAQDASARLTVVQRRFQLESAEVRLLSAEERLAVRHEPH